LANAKTFWEGASITATLQKGSAAQEILKETNSSEAPIQKVLGVKVSWDSTGREVVLSFAALFF